MMNVPKSSLDKIVKIIPSLKSPTVLPLADENMLAVHAVIPSDKFWTIIEDLKSAGASGILLLPIENMINNQIFIGADACFNFQLICPPEKCYRLKSNSLPFFCDLIIITLQRSYITLKGWISVIL